MRGHYRLSSCLILIVVGMFAAGCGGGAGADDAVAPIPVCGNSIVDAGEECDGGSETVTCDIDCSSIVCGDGTLNISAGERCDDGNIDPSDGLNCQRRKRFHRRIQEVYNPILENVLQEYIADDRLPNADYLDIFDFRFESEHVNNGDCFHPSTLGHKLMADEQWCRSPWSTGDPYCDP